MLRKFLVAALLLGAVVIVGCKSKCNADTCPGDVVITKDYTVPCDTACDQ